MSVATHRVTTENAPFADRNKNFLPFLKTFEIASSFIEKEKVLYLLSNTDKAFFCASTDFLIEFV